MKLTINKIAKYISDSLDQSQEEYEINVFVLNDWIHRIISIGLTYFTAFMLGVLEHSLIIGITASWLRHYSGGGHSKSPITCTMLSVIYVNLTALIIKNINLPSQFIATLTSLIILFGFYLIYKYAPADTSQKPIISLEFRQQLRKKSYIFLLTLLSTVNISYYLYGGYNWLILSIFFGLLWQLFSITPLGYRFLNNLDNLIDKMKGC